jgi:hypothetical protein
MTVTVIVTGFGPFPGAPFNPTGPLAKRLARVRRPTLANVKVVSHVFPTSYTAVDRELPTLIAEHKPDALLMFGLAPRARALRIETRARNTVTLLPDATGRAPQRLHWIRRQSLLFLHRYARCSLLLVMPGCQQRHPATPGIISATIFAGAFARSQGNQRGHGLRPSSMFPQYVVVHDRAAWLRRDLLSTT